VSSDEADDANDSSLLDSFGSGGRQTPRRRADLGFTVWLDRGRAPPPDRGGDRQLTYSLSK